MTIELRQARAEDVPELGRICYEAFKDISESHGFESDFPSIEFAQQVVGMLTSQEDVYGVAAFDGAAAKGSNFLELWDDVAGIGPVSVDVASQGEGVGRKTMEHVVAHARERGFEQVRLCQDSFNMRSLALYSSVGFTVKEPLSFMALSNANASNSDVRPATTADLDVMDELCRSIHGFSRRNETERLMNFGFPAFVLDRGGVCGYLLGTAMGHGVAQSDDDMAALVNTMGANVADAHSLVPLRNGALYRALLAAGHKNQKVMNLMAYGPYDEPKGTFCPSVLF
jgi:ribosomal protein S18 acetylase RimI-like enzyme